MKLLKAAMPVPGATMINGVSIVLGKVKEPFFSHTGIGSVCSALCLLSQYEHIPFFSRLNLVVYSVTAMVTCALSGCLLMAELMLNSLGLCLPQSWIRYAKGNAILVGWKSNNASMIVLLSRMQYR